jgi:hypothetical protein
MLSNSNRIISISAMLISLMTLGVFIYQTSLLRQQQFLSVLPYLSIGNYGTGTENFSIIIENNGIGPAFVESSTIFYDGETYEMDLPGFLLAHVPEMDSVNNFYYSNIYEGRMITAGETINVIQIDNSLEDTYRLMEVIQKLSKKEFNYELIYQSIYKERWKLSGGSTVPEKLN